MAYANNLPTPYYAKSDIPSDAVPALIHADHLIFTCSISAPSSPSTSRLPYAIVRRWLLCGCALAAKVDRPQLAPLTSPDTERSHYRCATYLKCPPEEVRGYRMRVEGRDKEMNEVDGEGEVEDQF